MKRNTKLDRIDLNILSALQQNGRQSNVTLSDSVGLSPSPCLQRVKRLEKAGFIKSYNAQIDLRKIGEHIVVFTEVTLSDHRKEDFNRFEDEIRKYPSVIECHLVSGGYDYLLKFVAHGVSHYQELIESILERSIGIEKYFSYIVIKSPIDQENVPIEAILPQEKWRAV